MPRIIRSGEVSLSSDNAFYLEVIQKPEVKAPADEQEMSSSELELSQEVLLEYAKDKASALISEAHADARAIRDEAYEEAERVLREAEEEGARRGFDQGVAEGSQEGERLRREAKAVYDKSLVEREQLLKSAEPQIVNLISNILDKLLPKIASVKQDVILNLIKQGLAGATITGTITIHVSKEDYETVVERKDEILSSIDTSATLEIFQDLSLSQSDCIIETPFGDIDCSLDLQLSGLKESLYFILENK